MYFVCCNFFSPAVYFLRNSCCKSTDHSAHYEVKFVYKYIRIFVAFLLIIYLFKTLFKLTTIFCPGNHSRKIKLINTFFKQVIRHVLASNSLRSAM